MQKRVAILIPVYNGLKFLVHTIPSILGQISQISGWKFELVIADDNSSDGTTEWIRQNYPEVVVLHGNGSLWWSGGINLGVRFAMENPEFEYVLLWNHDTTCDANYFETLVTKIPLYPKNTMIASKIYFLNQPSVIFNMGAFFNSLTGKRTLNGFGKSDSSEFANPCYVDWTGGMGTLIAVEIFKTVGLFDEVNFPQYYGDADFYLRAKEKGYKLIVLPDLKIWNDKTSSGMNYKKGWRSFFLSFISIRSNNNIFFEYKFLKRHCRSFLWIFYPILEFLKYFASFIKHWLKNLF